MQDQYVRPLTAALAVVAASLSACNRDPVVREADAETTTAALYNTGGVLWGGDAIAGHEIPVCWEIGSTDADPQDAASHPNFATLSATVRDAVDTSWAKAANIRFTGWANCPSNINTGNPHRIAIHWRSAGEPGNSNALVGDYGTIWTRMRLVVESDLNHFRGVVRHEFGHALGFDHEWDRPDNTNPNCDGIAGPPGNTFGTSPDATSIMNFTYCTQATGQLSGWDMYGVQQAYGPTAKNLAYFRCAGDGGSCMVPEGKYMAFGANGSYFFKPSNYYTATPCTSDFFGGDPAPGVPKACYFANYNYQVPENGSYNLGPYARDVAYGANGQFHFRTLTNSFDCNNETFGDPISGVGKACYTALPGYTWLAGENGSLTGLDNTPVAYGANGKFEFKILSGSATCNNATFGDPAPASSKQCYAVTRPRVATEGGTYVPSGGWPHAVAYTSGLNGNITYATAEGQPFACATATFGGDPHPGAQKYCYGP